MAETLAAALFLLRSKPVAVSAHAGDWLIGIAGTFGVFMFVPAGYGLLPPAKLLLLLGCLLQIAGLLSLNRSFALVAAQREIKTGGMYRLVRHPLYASYMLGFVGYVLSNTSMRNLAVAVVVTLLLLARIVREERLLQQDPAYRAYMRRVPYRLIPLIF
ncbi:methyltransferase family protein [Pseudoduganella sp. UC29_106]|uniref:methyltransferase family protein n=1 Tax=Pseudoduganella sp. UC29_106 TaxID=3374553 RepID=UPI0037575D76